MATSGWTEDERATNPAFAGARNLGKPNGVREYYAEDAPPPAFDADTQERDAWINRVELAKRRDAEAANLESRKMSRGDFLKKYALGQGGTFLADDKGGNSASEVAGQSVAEYYDKYLADGVAPRTMSVGGDGSTETVPWNWGGGTTRDALKQQIGLDAWSNVDPHPESNQQDGWNDAWQQVGKPIAMAAGMAYGVGALGGAAGAGSGAAAAASPYAISGGTGTLGAGSAATTGAAMGSTGAGLTTGGLTGATALPSATGLAGYMGMNAGYGATALNTGALNTGMSLARGNNIGDSLKSGATAALLSPVSGYVSGAVGGGTMGALAGSTASGAVQGGISGRGIINGARDGFVNGVVGIAGNKLGGWTSGATGSKAAGWLAKTGAKTALNSALKKKPVAKPRNVKTGGWA